MRAEQSSEAFASKAGDYPLRGSNQAVSVVEVVLRKAQRDWAVFKPYYTAKVTVLRGRNQLIREYAPLAPCLAQKISHGRTFGS